MIALIVRTNCTVARRTRDGTVRAAPSTGACMRRLALMSVLAGSALAHADDSPEIDPPILPVDMPSEEASAVERPLVIPEDDTAASVAAAPRPGEESGRVDSPPGDNFFRVVGRGA